MRSALMGLALLLAGLPAAAPGLPACDVKTVKKGEWCETCQKALGSKDLSGKNCKQCSKPYMEVDLCIKITHMGCHNGPQTKAYT